VIVGDVAGAATATLGFFLERSDFLFSPSADSAAERKLLFGSGVI
jgi:hypothetical protein